MPTVFREAGFRFFFYSNDHRPVHAHVIYGDAEADFSVEGEVALRENHGLKQKDLLKAQALAQAHRNQIIETWHASFS